MASLGLTYLMSDSDVELILDSQPIITSEPVPSPELSTQQSPEPSTQRSPKPIPTPNAPGYIQLPLPPLNQQFNTPEEGAEVVNTFARPYGYAVTIRRSKYTKNGVKKTVYLCCDRGRAVKYEETVKKRRTTTLALGCPFMVVLRLDLQTNLWHLTIDDSKSKHNHQPSPASTHTAQRKLDLTHKSDQVENGLRQGHTTRQILTEIRETDPESVLIPQDIYNARKKLSQLFLAGRTPLQALLIELPKDGGWIFKYELDDQSHVSALFCMHKSSIAMLRKNPWVISMDCTYKTNRYGLPLLDIVGFAATGSTFHLAFAFMRDEKDDSYEVMLTCLAEAYESLALAPPSTILTDKEEALIKAIEVVFPSTKHMLCIWHINMNILKKARPILADQVAQARREAQANTSRKLTAAERNEDRKKAEAGWKKMLQRWNRIVGCALAAQTGSPGLYQ
ncbi:hypothetical protein N7471_010664 [Penicillium samsonianum]|uniref:uncharacterized protein n=1 Tax=Penicillium samsonianum TaxID=1882272 RepID=UPI00254802ED|nr:uncharacterized protein N7471_010530 [Penicillium samsonianum]XP_057132230.1 uncharacterized protein N7471_010532 [Penicillium samsonianum]XP_057132271.1 uncharacterized protein N7471_010573 [Penicillium samsonianum]XP_057132362.1 uncharacterized protein N7471_010664 [Penicillium samsonianum]KAJ6126037.1 hypothetical protein N7471_010530 [Penicillium samsonianum]KAJ6126039.1 hypothetical protein N7471_010532 [Penicillium samsonianum]KAJ6126080.1 hypothetical protein N7471_010573 [Penicilli